uniref:Uncharacterized protein n=1 Tax=Arundo donax TaxID=35708 RepID=A0A0A9C649_ARUDO
MTQKKQNLHPYMLIFDHIFVQATAYST